ncbi:MAG: hypothetical protein O8C64_01235 [Candidatus Methanoperedens sp.]|nr:hypothetical protein [Candidatus Methanoperedens sp.]MCZ7404459.1 hypothetical protein [Candidatus Methanoperedens sp.]
MSIENSSKKLPNDLIGVAGVHFAVSVLTLRGLIALPTIRNTAGIDILVSEPDGSGQASLQVKTSLKKVNFWPTSHPEKCLKGPRSFYLFLRYLPEEMRFEPFLEAGDEVAKQVLKNLEDYKARGKKEFPYWALPSNDNEIQKLRERWEAWRPPAI